MIYLFIIFVLQIKDDDKLGLMIPPGMNENFGQIWFTSKIFPIYHKKLSQLGIRMSSVPQLSMPSLSPKDIFGSQIELEQISPEINHLLNILKRADLIKEIELKGGKLSKKYTRILSELKQEVFFCLKYFSVLFEIGFESFIIEIYNIFNGVPNIDGESYFETSKKPFDLGEEVLVINNITRNSMIATNRNSDSSKVKPDEVITWKDEKSSKCGKIGKVVKLLTTEYITNLKETDPKAYQEESINYIGYLVRFDDGIELPFTHLNLYSLLNANKLLIEKKCVYIHNMLNFIIELSDNIFILSMKNSKLWGRELLQYKTKFFKMINPMVDSPAYSFLSLVKNLKDNIKIKREKNQLISEEIKTISQFDVNLNGSSNRISNLQYLINLFNSINVLLLQLKSNSKALEDFYKIQQKKVSFNDANNYIANLLFSLATVKKKKAKAVEKEEEDDS